MFTLEFFILKDNLKRDSKSCLITYSSSLNTECLAHCAGVSSTAEGSFCLQYLQVYFLLVVYKYFL